MHRCLDPSRHPELVSRGRRWRRPQVWLFAMACSLPRPASAWTSPAPDVVVYAQRSMGGIMQASAARFLAVHGVHVHVFFNSSDGLLGLIRHGARADVVVADRATLDQLGALLVGGSRTTLGVDRWVLVAPSNADIAPNRGAAQLIATHEIVLSDPTSAASFNGRQVLQAIAPGVAAIGVADAPDIVVAVLREPDRIGLVHASDIGGRRDLAVVDDLPGAPAATLEAATLTGGQSGQAAAFVRFLTSADDRTVLRAGGLNVTP